MLRFEPNLDSTALRELADAIAEGCGGTAAVFSGQDGGGYGFCLVSRQGDLRPLGKALTAAQDFWIKKQGAPDKAALLEFVKNLNFETNSDQSNRRSG